jgi:hypothetical protein
LAVGTYSRRTRQLAGEDHLPYEDVVRVLEFIHDADAVVVGGQSLAIWSRHYLERRPQIASHYSMTSDDVDFYGSKATAQKFASKLDNATVHLPGPDDSTPHSAVVVGLVGDRKIQVDFLHSILGVDTHSIENNFVTLSGRNKNNGREVNIIVLHPLDCLRSRMSNINDLRRYDEHSLSSALASVEVLDAFLDDLLENGLTKEAQATLHNLHFVIKESLHKPSFQRFGLDPRPILVRRLDDTRLDTRWREFNLSGSIRRLEERLNKLQRAPSEAAALLP